ncbi:unnamed protein product, partial [Amoebophrya sp. A25]
QTRGAEEDISRDTIAKSAGRAPATWSPQTSTSGGSWSESWTAGGSLSPQEQSGGSHY